MLEHNLSCQGLSKSSTLATHAKFKLLANLVSIHRILIQYITNMQTSQHRQRAVKQYPFDIVIQAIIKPDILHLFIQPTQ